MRRKCILLLLTMVVSALGGLNAQGTLSLPYYHDFEGDSVGPSSPLPEGWSRVNNTTDTGIAGPYVMRDFINSRSGSRSLLFHLAASTVHSGYTCAALPPLAANSPVQGLRIDFWAKGDTGDAKLFLLLLPDSLPAADMVAVDSFDLSPFYRQYTAMITVDGGTWRRVAFGVRYGTTSARCHLDDLAITERPACPSPENLTVTPLTHATALASWEDSLSSSWRLYWSATGADSATLDSMTATSNPAIIQGLAAGTQYQATVAALCPDGNSSPLSSPATFTTPCLPIPTDSLPYVETFDSYPATTDLADGQSLPPCWSKGTNGPTAFPYLYYDSSVAPSNLMLFSSSPTLYSYAVLPLFADSLNRLLLRFDLIGDRTFSGKIVVGVMTAPDDISTFTPVDTCYPHPTADTWRCPFEVEMNRYHGNEGHIAFLLPADTVNYSFLDNVSVALLTDCPPVHHLSATPIDGHHARLSWRNDGTGTPLYQVACGRGASFQPDSAAFDTTVADTTVVVGGLASFATYRWAVRALCGNDTGAWTDIHLFRTPLDCGPQSLNLVDTLGNDDAGQQTLPFGIGISSATGTSRHIITTAALEHIGVSSDNRLNSIALHCGDTGGTIHSAVICIAETDLDTFNPADTIAWPPAVQVYHGDIVCRPNEWVEIPFDTAFPFAGNRNLLITLSRQQLPSASIAFSHSSTAPAARSCQGGSIGDTLWVDSVVYSTVVPDFILNICTAIPQCNAPTDVALLSLTHDSLAIAWHGAAEGYETALGPAGFDPDTTAHLFTTDSHIAYGGLIPNTVYDFYVRSRCSNGSSDGWTSLTTLTTACTPSPLPFAEGFENYGIGPSATLDPCWKKGTNLVTAYPFPYPSNAISGTQSLYFYATRTTTATTYSYVVLPLLAAPVDSLQLSFKVRRYGSTSASATTRLVVGLMTNPCDIATFYPVDTVDMRNDAPLSVRSVEVSFAGHASYGRYIALYDESPTPIPGVSTLYSYAYVDDVLVDYLPFCPTPAAIQIADSGIAATTALIDWDQPVDHSIGYEVEYGPEGFALGTGNRVDTDTNHAALTGLTPGTTYDLYLRVVCSDSDTGDWSTASHFTTAQIPDTVPLFYDFEDSVQWASWQTLSNTTAAWYCGTAPYSGSGHAIFISADQGSSVDTDMHSTVSACAYRDIDFGTIPRRYNLSFNINVGGSTGEGHDGMAVMLVDPAAPVQPAGIPLATPWGGVEELSLAILRSTGGWQHIDLPIDSLTGVWRLVFCWFSQPDSLSLFSGHAPAIDSLGIDYYIPCPPPLIDSTGSTYESIDLHWTGEADTYDVAITSGEWSATIEPVATLGDTHSYRFYGLMPSTVYTVGVRQHCSGVDTSVWATVTVVTDSLRCTPVEHIMVSDITLHSATFDWESTGMERRWDLHIWSPEGTDTLLRTSTHPVVLDGLESGIHYSCTVRPLCGSTLVEGDWSDTVTFVTSDCPTVTGIIAEEITTDRVTLSWNASPFAHGWTIEYGSAGFSQGTGTTAHATTNSLVINGLDCASEYDFYVMAQCDTNLSSLNWGFVSATTSPCPDGCSTPTGITTTPYNTNVTVEWTPSEGNNSFEVEYGMQGFQHGAGTTLLTNESFTTINNLERGIHYDLYVRAVCSMGSHSEWSPVHTFTIGTEGIDLTDGTTCTLFPNPASSSVTVATDGTHRIVRIDIMDMNGRTLQTTTPPNGGSTTVALNLAGINAGTCFVRIVTHKASIVRRLVIVPSASAR